MYHLVFPRSPRFRTHHFLCFATRYYFTTNSRSCLHCHNVIFLLLCINYLDNSIIIKCPSNTAPHCHILFRSSLFQTPLIPSIGKLGCRRLQLSFYTVPHMPSEPRFQTPLGTCHFSIPWCVFEFAAVPCLPSRVLGFW